MEHQQWQKVEADLVQDIIWREGISIKSQLNHIKNPIESPFFMGKSTINVI